MATPAHTQRYQVMEPLGRGGQGTTFRGVDRKTGRQVAIKVLSLKGAKGWKAFDLFEREIDTLAKLSHPGIPTYLDKFAYESSGDYFLVMELIDGAPLSNFLGRDTLPTTKVRAVFDQCLVVLGYLHAQKPPIVHRDGKPGNIILRPDSTVALVDFGGVRQRMGGTEASTMVGTFGYMAPEQLHGDASPAADLYALGATTLALLTGTSPEDLPRKGLRFNFDALSLPAPFDRVLPQLLEPDPTDRLASIAEVRTALRTKPKPPPRAAPTPKRETAPQPEPSKALQKIPEGAVALANTPAPFSILIWVLASLSAGVLLVFEAVFLPFFFQLAVALRNQPQSDPRAQAFRKDFEDFKASVDEARRAASHVADGTRPSV